MDQKDDAKYHINLSTHIQHHTWISSYSFWSLRSSPFIIKLYLSVHKCNIRLEMIISDIPSFPASIKFVPLSPVYIYIYFMQKQYHQHIKWIQNVKTLFPNHTSCQVQVCFSGSLVSGRWDCCCSGICLSQEQMHEASTKSYQLFGHATKRGLGYLQLLEIGECSQRWADWST